MAEYEALRDAPGLPRQRSAASAGHGHDACGRENGQTLTTDGPFADTKEVFGGYYLFDAGQTSTPRSSWPTRIPALRLGGAVEVRPLVEAHGPDRAASSATSGAASSPPWSASSATSTSPRRPPRRRSRSPPSAGRATASPDNPGAWLITTARNRAIDRMRRERTLAAKARLLESAEDALEDAWTSSDDTVIPDERLELLFTCCHPALATDAQVALTLRALGGLEHRGDRARVPRRARDDEAPAVPGQGEDQASPGSRSACRPTTCCPSGWRRCWRSST